MVSSTSETQRPAPAGVAAYATALGDDALIASHRLGEQIAHAPQIEEDVALANIALDLLGQARSLLTYAGTADDRTEDQLAYFREGREFRNVHLVERPNGDFAVTMARLLMLSCYQAELYAALTQSSDPTLAAVAAKAVKEVAYHRDHASSWVVRLGDGTAESRRRMQAGLEAEWPYLDELFEPFDPGDPADSSETALVDPSQLEQPVLGRVRGVLTEATLDVPESGAAVTGGRRGVHTESFGFLLAQMQHLARSHPGATW